MSSSSELRIVHVFRAPLGGLVSSRDRPRGRAGRARLTRSACSSIPAAIARACARRSRAFPAGSSLGVAMTPIRRNPHPSDIAAIRAFSAYLGRGPPRRRARARLEGRPVRAARRRRAGGRSAPTRRTAAASTTPRAARVHALYHGGRAGAGAAHRPVPVRKRPYRRKCDAYVGGARQPRARRRQRAQTPRNSRPRRRPRTPPTFSMSANCAPPRASTRCSTRSRSLARETGRTLARDAGRLRSRSRGARRASRTAGAQPPVRFPARCRRARPSRSGASWSCRRAPNRCPTSCSKAWRRGAAAHHRSRRHPRDLRPLSRPARPPRRPGRSRAPHRRGAAPRRRAERLARAAELAAYVRERFSIENMVETVISAYREALARRDLAPDRRDARRRRRASCQRGVSMSRSVRPIRLAKRRTASARRRRGAEARRGLARLFARSPRSRSAQAPRSRASSRPRACALSWRMSCSRSARSRSISCFRFGMALISVLAFQMLQSYSVPALRRPINQLFRMSGGLDRRLRRAHRRRVLRQARRRDLALLARQPGSSSASTRWRSALRLGGRWSTGSPPPGGFQKRVVVVGGGELGARPASAISPRPIPPRSRLLGVFDDRGDERSPQTVEGFAKLGNVDDLVEFARQTRVDLVDLRAADHRRAAHPADAAQALGAADRHPARRARQPLRFRPRSYSYVGAAPMLDVFDKPLADWDVVVKLALRQDRRRAGADRAVAGPARADGARDQARLARARSCSSRSATASTTNWSRSTSSARCTPISSTPRPPGWSPATIRA